MRKNIANNDNIFDDFRLGDYTVLRRYKVKRGREV